MVHAGCVFVASIHPSRTQMSGSFESVRWNARVHRLDLGLYSHPKGFWGNGVKTHVNSKGKIPSTGKILQRGGSNPRRCYKQDSEPNTLPTSYSCPTPLPSPLCLTFFSVLFLVCFFLSFFFFFFFFFLIFLFCGVFFYKSYSNLLKDI